MYLAVSDFVRDKYVQAGFPEGRLLVKPNFVAAGQRRTGPGDFFLFLGRLSPEKGLGTLLAAWPRVRQRLVVVGDGPDRSLLRDAGSTVEHRNGLSRDEAVSLLSRARALLLPSLSYEGSPRVVLEAYAAGVPVVGSRTGSLPQLIEDDASGLLVRPADAAAWAAAVDRLTDDAESERMGEHARRLWEEHYSPACGLEHLEGAYRAALQRPAHARA
jgi:glycosyltransferase involved in cell wall biosynthesis